MRYDMNYAVKNINNSFSNMVREYKRVDSVLHGKLYDSIEESKDPHIEMLEKERERMVYFLEKIQTVHENKVKCIQALVENSEDEHND
jgi:hypothetical protein